MFRKNYVFLLGVQSQEKLGKEKMGEEEIMELYKEKIAKLVANSEKMASMAPDQSGHRILSLYREALNAEKDNHGHQHEEDDLKIKEGSEHFEVGFPEDPTVPGNILIEEQLSDPTLNKSISPDNHDTNRSRTEGEPPQEVESKVELLGPEQAEKEGPIGEVEDENIDHSNSSSTDSESKNKTLHDSEVKPSQRNEKDSTRMHHHDIPKIDTQKPDHAHKHEVEELEKTTSGGSVILTSMTTKTQEKTKVTTTSAHNHEREEIDKGNDVIKGEELDETRTHEHKEEEVGEEERKTEEVQKEVDETEVEEKKIVEIIDEKKPENMAEEDEKSDTYSENDAIGDHERQTNGDTKKEISNNNEKSGSSKVDMVEIAKGHRSETKHALVRDVVALTLATVALISAVGFIAYTTTR